MKNTLRSNPPGCKLTLKCGFLKILKSSLALGFLAMLHRSSNSFTVLKFPSRTGFNGSGGSSNLSWIWKINKICHVKKRKIDFISILNARGTRWFTVSSQQWNGEPAEVVVWHFLSVINSINQTCNKMFLFQINFHSTRRARKFLNCLRRGLKSFNWLNDDHDE